MSLTLYSHPLSSFCQKVLVALYELETPFTAVTVDLSNPAARAELAKLWPPARFPVLHDAANDRAVAESTIIIEYLVQRSLGPAELLPSDADAALMVRSRDRLFDIDIHVPMQKIVNDIRRPEAQRDPLGVAAARAQIRTGYRMVEAHVAQGPWACGEAFTLADCAAAPALAYADACEPIGGDLPRTAAYLARLAARPSFARVLREAAPFLKYFPFQATFMKR